MSIYQSQYILKYQAIADYIKSVFSTKTPLIVGNAGASPHYQTITVSGLSSVVAFEQPFTKTQDRVQSSPKPGRFQGMNSTFYVLRGFSLTFFIPRPLYFDLSTSTCRDISGCPIGRDKYSFGRSKIVTKRSK